MANGIVTATAAATELEPAPITPGWILSGTPEARNKILANSQDRTSSIMVWECTPGNFNWHYGEDETIVIISGEVFLTPQGGQERRLGPGDMAFFPAGCSAHWRVTSKVRKVAVWRSAVPFPLALGVRAWNKLLRVIGLRA
jgi:uncharacterized protein